MTIKSLMRNLMLMKWKFGETHREVRAGWSELER